MNAKKTNPSRPVVLFVSPCTPDNTGVGWEQRAFSMLQAYSNHLDVNLWFTPTLDNPDLERAKKLSKLCKSISVFHPKLIIKNPDELSRFHAAIKNSDCIHLFRNMGLMNIKHKCIFWDIDELPIELRDNSRNQRIKPFTTESITNAFSKYSRSWKMARRVFSSSHVEANKLLGDVFYMPNVYSIENKKQNKTTSGNIIFVGNTNFYPNIDAIFYFTKLVLPLLPKSTNFTVIGRGPLNQELIEKYIYLEKNYSVNFIYNVESCSPYYYNASVAVAPINFGGGTKLKVLEAFSHYCPVVSTSKGCEGIEVCDGEEVLIRDNPNAFAEACQKIIKNPEIGESLAEKAHILLSSNYSQNKINELLLICLIEEGIL